MATGRGNYLTKQTGEYIVAAELSRRGFVATTFTGNVPTYDIVAVDERGGHALVQVKAIAAGSWQLNVGQFAEVAFRGEKQIMGDPRPEPYPNLVCVMVKLAAVDTEDRDCFYVLPWRELATMVVEGHRRYLAKHGGVRPRSPHSLHSALHPASLTKWEGRWDVVMEIVGAKGPRGSASARARRA